MKTKSCTYNNNNKKTVILDISVLSKKDHCNTEVTQKEKQ